LETFLGAETGIAGSGSARSVSPTLTVETTSTALPTDVYWTLAEITTTSTISTPTPTSTASTTITARSRRKENKEINNRLKFTHKYVLSVSSALTALMQLLR